MRQPVHVVYGGAHLFKFDTARKLGKLAERALAEYVPDAATLAEAVGLRDDLAATVYERMVEKLRHEPVEDFRINFEDGFGIRSDAEEDAAVDAAAAQLNKGLEDGTLPPFIGLRVKSFGPESKPRALRTLNRFLKAAGRLPDEFVVTLPKITESDQVPALLEALAPYPNIGVELMVETSLSLRNLLELVELAEGRCVGAHFGPYDYTASLGITSHNQHLLHPACHFARSTMLMTLAGSGIALSDGPTNILPIPPHRGNGLSESQKTQNRAVVHRAWKLHYQHVRDALYNGFYQGWDLHPAQLPIRYAAVYSFFLEGLDAASERLRNFIRMAMQATMVGDVFDDAATGQGLRNYFLRAVSCGAVPESDIPALTGLTLEQLRSARF
ncbi:MAG: phosphoenolpyruvate kinase [Acidobacteriota bacterium]